jgi:DNA repair exonuclease SbcCD ATPase subunit
MILVDSPGFDDTKRTDIEILKTIGLHLQQGSKEKKYLTGVIYMRRITDNRMHGSALNNLRVLKKLCGADHYAHIALVTSQWDVVAPAEGESRENQLRTEDEYWGEMIQNGATVNRHSNSTESAIKILRQFLRQSPFELQFQKEFIATQGNIGDTAAGKEIIEILWGKLGEYKDQISKLTEDNEKAKVERVRMDGEMRILKADVERLRRERERDRKREREINKILRRKEELIEQANDAREKVEGEIQQLKAAIDELKQEKEKENSLNEELISKQKLIDEANLKKETEGVQQGKQTERAVEEDLKSEEEFVAEGEKDKADGKMQGLIREIEKLKLEKERQKAVNESLKLKEQLLEKAENSKKKAEEESEIAENEIQEEMEKLQQSKEKENAVTAGLNLKTQRISEIEKERDEKDGEMEVNATQVKALEANTAIATEAMMSLKQSAINDIYEPRPVNSKRRWARLPHCTHQ